MGTPQATGDTGPVATGRTRPRRPLLAGGLLTAYGLVDVLAAHSDTVADPYMVVTPRGIYQIDFTGWAWLELVVGAAVTIVGLLVITGWRWTARVAIVCAVLAIGLDVIAFPYKPVQVILMVTYLGAAIRLLVRHRTQPSGRLPRDRAGPTG